MRVAVALLASVFVAAGAAPAFAGDGDQPAADRLSACDSLGDHPTKDQVQGCVSAAARFVAAHRAMIDKARVEIRAHQADIEAAARALHDNADAIRQAEQELRASADEIRGALRELRENEQQLRELSGQPPPPSEAPPANAPAE